MAMKKAAAGGDFTEIIVKEEGVAALDEPVAPKTMPAAPQADDAAYCVYIGPTIHGVIQSGCVIRGNRAAAMSALSAAIAKYPLAARLIVTDKTLAESRVKVKTAGNVLNVYYKKLVSGKSE